MYNLEALLYCLYLYYELTKTGKYFENSWNAFAFRHGKLQQKHSR